MERDPDGVIDLSTIAQGAAAELFSEELDKVLENIQDPNTDPERARTITLKFTIKPGKTRDVGTVRVASEAKLAPVRPADAMLFFGKREGRRVAVEHDPKQAGLFDANRPATVTPIESGRK